MEPLSLSALTVLASLCMPPKSIDVFPLVYTREEVVIGYPSLAGVGLLFGHPVVGIVLEYQFGTGRIQKLVTSGNQPDVENRVRQLLEPHYCVAVG